eukprot:6370427-Prymnesium_polylepis.1
MRSPSARLVSPRSPYAAARDSNRGLRWVFPLPLFGRTLIGTFPTAPVRLDFPLCVWTCAAVLGRHGVATTRAQRRRD